MSIIIDNYDTEADITSFEALPIGEYLANIIKVEKSAISTRTPCGDSLNISWQIKEGAWRGRILLQKFNLWYKSENIQKASQVREIANSQFANLRLSLFGRINGRIKLVSNSEELLAAEAIIVVKQKLYHGNIYNEVVKVKPSISYLAKDSEIPF